ncbi:MAG: type VI secretion system contractile sheath large subunit [Betaproteobacteria bacterium]|nr:type VI secretion system contractile sheath large subunit [Betaproteobacteria bacterium]
MNKTTQKTLLRVRPPRVRITYDVETGGAIEKKEIPFTVGIFADLSADLPKDQWPPFKERTMTNVDRDNFDDLMKTLAPQVNLAKVAMGNDAQGQPIPALTGILGFTRLQDFDPAEIVQRIDGLKDLYKARQSIRTLQAMGEMDDALGKGLNDWLGGGTASTGVDQPLLDAFDRHVKQALAGNKIDLTSGVNPRSPLDTASAMLMIDRAVVTIDKELSLKLSRIMHHPNFKDLEAAWRGLYYLVSRTETGTMLKLRVFNAKREELLDDMEKAVEFDQSVLFKMIYEAEYGTYGGFPYSLLIGAYEFGVDAASINCLQKISEVAAAAHAPFIAGANPAMFGLDSFTKLGKPRDLAKIFEGADLVGWNEFRDREDSRYVSLVLPHILLRLPYGDGGLGCDGMNFQEEVRASTAEPPGHGNFLWGNAAFALAERITHAFALYSWTAAIRGVEGGGLVTELPLYAYDTSTGSRELFCPTEVAITDRREKELNDLGFISLCHCKGAGKAAFFGGQTANRPKKYITEEANANARISAMLPTMLAASRFEHYIKVIMREMVGSFMTRGNVEAYLNTWISQYVLLDDNATQEVKASYPLRAASVVVSDIPGEPGAYNAVAFLQPHFQLEELTTSIRLVAKLPA